jgi:hypothetical protein
LVAVFIAANEGYHPDLFPAHVSTLWFGAYWIVLGVLLTYLFGYAARVMLIVRKDPRSTVTANLYLISAAFGVAATVIQVTTAEAGIDITLPVWLCACLGAIGFSYGSARSWHAKVAWFKESKRATLPQNE